ncbi:hypothetical protein ACFS7Z_03020 [Pontibacter toksunensis]|uniref:Uncharacterized protein n=1 Tax=Pontibacter toksunensis TaxID=1332631 RepID=A0ABW6BPY2_9BACT
MKTLFVLQGSSIVLKTYNEPVQVYPGMKVILKDKEYTVQHANLSLDKDEVAVTVERAST